jgi:hypothetical protein
VIERKKRECIYKYEGQLLVILSRLDSGLQESSMQSRAKGALSKADGPSSAKPKRARAMP